MLTIGLTQDLDSPNVTVGELVSSYELWNLQYATLTDLAADDFAIDPGPRRVVELRGRQEVDVHAARGSRVVRRHAADRRGRRVHDQPLARGGVAEPHLDRRRTSPREATDDRTRRRDVERQRPEAARALRLHRPEAHLREDRRRRDHASTRRIDGVASGPFSLAEWKKGQFWRMDGEPELLARPGRDRRGRLPRLPEPGRDGRRAAERRARRRAQRAGGRVPAASRPPRTSSRSRASRAASTTSSEQLRGQATARRRRSSTRRIRRCSTSASARRSPTRSTRRRSSSACCRGSARRGRR